MKTVSGKKVKEYKKEFQEGFLNLMQEEYFYSQLSVC